MTELYCERCDCELDEKNDEWYPSGDGALCGDCAGFLEYLAEDREVELAKEEYYKNKYGDA